MDQPIQESIHKPIQPDEKADDCSGCKFRSRLWGVWICTKYDKAALKRCESYSKLWLEVV